MTVPHVHLLRDGCIEHPLPIGASQVGKSCWVAIFLTESVVRLVFLVRMEHIDDPGAILEVLILRGLHMDESLAGIVVDDIAGFTPRKGRRKDGFQKALARHSQTISSQEKNWINSRPQSLDLRHRKMQLAL